MAANVENSTAGNKKTVELFYDLISPYSYLAFEILSQCKGKWQSMDLKLRPASLKEVMISTGNHAPASVTAKKIYMGADLLRLSSFYKIPLAIPKDVNNVMSVKGSKNAHLLLFAVIEVCPQYLEEVTRQLYQRIWYRDEDITEDASFEAALSAAGLPKHLANECIDLSKDPKQEVNLKNNTDDALRQGVFGMPASVLHSDGNAHLFFGCDRLFLLAHFLGEELPLKW